MSTERIEALLVTHRPLQEVMIRRLVLLFDRVHVLEPRENKFLIPRGVAKITDGQVTIEPFEFGLLFEGAECELKDRQLLDRIGTACARGLVSELDLLHSGFFHTYWLPLRIAYDFDTGNQELLETALGFVERRASAKPPAGILRGLFVEPSHRRIYPNIPRVPPVFGTDEAEKFRYELQAFSMVGKLDRALAACGHFDLIPVFGDAGLAKLAAIKTKMVRAKQEPDMREKFIKTKGFDIDKIQHLLLRISELMLPDEVLMRIPMTELVTARNNTFHELQRLRRDLLSSLRFLSAHPFDEDFSSEVEHYVQSKLRPQLDAYFSRTQELLARFLKIGVTFAAASIPMFATIIQSISPLELALLTGISATVGSEVSDLTTQLVARSRRDFRNTFSYFLGFRGPDGE